MRLRVAADGARPRRNRIELSRGQRVWRLWRSMPVRSAIGRGGWFNHCSPRMGIPPDSIRNEHALGGTIENIPGETETGTSGDWKLMLFLSASRFNSEGSRERICSPNWLLADGSAPRQ